MVRRAVSILFTAFLVTGSANAQETPVVYPLHGVVLDARTGEPVPEVRIRVLVPHVAETVTDRTGAFDLELLALPVELEASRQGYDPRRMTIDNVTAPVTLKLEPHAIPVASVDVSTTRATDRGSAVAFTNLDRKAVQDRYWAQDVPMLLAETPGVYAYSDARNGIGYSYVKIRGFRSAAWPSRSTESRSTIPRRTRSTGWITPTSSPARSSCKCSAVRGARSTARARSAAP